MQVLERKEPPKESLWSAKKTCGRCGSLLLVEQGDLYMVRKVAFMGVEDAPRPYFSCPVCDTKNFLEYGELSREQESQTRDPFSVKEFCRSSHV